MTWMSAVSDVHGITWRHLLDCMLQRGATVAHVRHSAVPHPQDAGFKSSIAFPAGQRATYRLKITDRTVVDIDDYATHYTVHIHRITDTPDVAASSIEAGAALGAMLGLAVGKSTAAATVGSVLGALLGAKNDHYTTSRNSQSAHPEMRQGNRGSRSRDSLAD